MVSMTSGNSFPPMLSTARFTPREFKVSFSPPRHCESSGLNVNLAPSFFRRRCFSSLRESATTVWPIAASSYQYDGVRLERFPHGKGAIRRHINEGCARRLLFRPTRGDFHQVHCLH